MERVAAGVQAGEGHPALGAVTGVADAGQGPGPKSLRIELAEDLVRTVDDQVYRFGRPSG